MKPIKELFDIFSNLSILVVGDVMIDRYLTGNIERISPEAPVPIVLHQNTENRLGGAANVALNLSALGATPYLCSVIGKDENATLLLSALQEQELSTRAIIQSSDRKTTVKTRVLAANQHILRVDREDTFDLSEQERTLLLAQIKTLLETKTIDLILFQDYNKGVLSERMIRETSLEAIRRDIPIAVDPKKRNFFAYKKSTLFKPNLKEIRANLPFEINPTISDLTKASFHLRQKTGHRFTMITLSDKGIFIDDGKNQAILDTKVRKIADVCGAGDTVISIASLGLAAGLSLEEMALISNIAGGQVCERVGVVPVDKMQLKKELLSTFFKQV